MVSDSCQAAGAVVLSDQVRHALRQYFTQLNGYPVTDLHAMVMGEVEKPLIQTVLEQAGYNQTKAAQMLGVSRGTLRKKMAQYGLE